VAVNCLVAPTAKSAEAGVTKIEDNVGGGGDVRVGVDVDEQLAATRLRATISIKVR